MPRGGLYLFATLLPFALLAPSRVHAGPLVSPLPAYLPRYGVAVDLDVSGHRAAVRMTATWTNPTGKPTDRLVFNVHSRYVVPGDQIGFMAKMLEILRVQPSEALGYTTPPCTVDRVSLAGADGQTVDLPFTFEGDTKTAMVVPLPGMIGPDESVRVVLEMTFILPQKQGRWGQWDGVTTLSNWLPVFAYYGEEKFGAPKPGSCPTPPLTTGAAVPPRPRLVRAHGGRPADVSWQPTPFVPWHQPFFNEAGIYAVSVILPANQEVASTGTIRACTPLPEGKKRLEIEAIGVREFTLLCSARYKVFTGFTNAGPGCAPVKIRILAFDEHAFYAKQMVRICAEALATYAQWLGPYPYPEFSIAEAFFGWNGNECSTLVMIDERVFAMPHIAVGYVEYLVSHEVCHQWWYNLVGTNGYCETWMDEAFASYFSHRLLNRKVGRDNKFLHYPAGLEWLPNIRRDDYRSTGMYGTFGRGENSAVIQEMPKFGHLVNLFNMCYDKGARIVGIIEDRLQEAAFIDFMRLVVRKYQYRIIGVSDFLHELEAYTGQHACSPDGTTDWRDFFEKWLYGPGLSDWSIEKVEVTESPKCLTDHPHACPLRRRWLICRGSAAEERPCPDIVERPIPPGGVKVHVWVAQKDQCDEPTTLGFELPGCEGYSVRVRVLPGADSYVCDDPPAKVTRLEPCQTPKRGARMLVEVILPAKPTQIAIDPDQVLVDANPVNNFWHTPIRWRFTPLFTFLEESDLTNAYDRWNIIFGPWLYSSTYESAWFTRSTMVGARAALYRTQEFSGGGYAAYRTNFRDVVGGFDATWEHWPFGTSQVGIIAEQRLYGSNNGDPDARRAVLWGRYIFNYNSSLYLPPIHFIESFAQYSDNFLPYTTQPVPGGVRFDRTTSLGLHYRINYLTPYWDPQGGFQFDTWYEGGMAQVPTTVGVQKLAANFTIVKSLPDLSAGMENRPKTKAVLDWISDTRLAVRAYGATSAPARGEFFTMGGSDLFRGFDLAQRQGSGVWVANAEWRVPILRRTGLEAFDHVAKLQNVYGAAFYDVGDSYIRGHQVGPVAHALGTGLRFDVSWFSFIERTTLRIDVAKTINANTGIQVWLGLNQPF